jgi:hypothetical protein
MRARKPGVHPLSDDASFELSKDAEHLKHGLVRRRLRDQGVLTGDNVAIDASAASDSECIGCSQFPPNMANSAPRCWAQ